MASKLYHDILRKFAIIIFYDNIKKALLMLSSFQFNFSFVYIAPNHNKIGLKVLYYFKVQTQ